MGVGVGVVRYGTVKGGGCIRARVSFTSHRYSAAYARPTLLCLHHHHIPPYHRRREGQCTGAKADRSRCKFPVADGVGALLCRRCVAKRDQQLTMEDHINDNR